MGVLVHCTHGTPSGVVQYEGLVFAQDHMRLKDVCCAFEGCLNKDTCVQGTCVHNAVCMSRSTVRRGEWVQDRVWKEQGGNFQSCSFCFNCTHHCSTSDEAEHSARTHACTHANCETHMQAHTYADAHSCTHLPLRLVGVAVVCWAPAVAGTCWLLG